MPLLYRRLLQGILMFAVLMAPSMGQTATPSVLKTTGRKFMVYPSRLDSLWDRVTLYITTTSPGTVRVRLYTPMRPTRQGGVDVTLRVSRSQPLRHEIQTGLYALGQDKLTDGLTVISSQDIAVFVNNPSSNASGVTAILSHDSLGTSYLFPSIRRTFDAQTSILIGNPDGPNVITVTLPIGPRAPTLQWKTTSYGPGQTFKVTMNKYEFADIRHQEGTGSGDLTGTSIVSTGRVALFSAAVFYPKDSSVWRDPIFKSDKDITIENVPPVSSWGRTYVVVATPSRSPGDLIRVMAGNVSTRVWFSDGASALLPARGDFLQREVPPGALFSVHADQPIQVIQFRFEFTADSAPFMFHVAPVESYGVTFTVPIIFNGNPLLDTENFVVVVVHVCYADRVLLMQGSDPQKQNYVSMIATWRTVANTSYVAAQVPVNMGFVTLAMQASDDVTADDDVTLGGFFFGLGPGQAYAAPLGLSGRTDVKTMQWAFPASGQHDAPITAGKSTLVVRDRRAMTLPLTPALEVRSRVECHHQCWKDPRCAFVVYTQAKVTQDKVTVRRGSCLLLNPTAQCSGLVGEPGALMYRLDRH